MNREEKIEVLTQSVCGKPPSLSPSACHAVVGARNPLCNENEFCRISQQSDEQLSYVLSPTSKCVFLKACPGSGKTEVVGLKSAYEMSRWRLASGGIAVVTFTKNAASVIEKRVSQFGGTVKIGFPHFIGTIDSWLHGYIANPFGHTITGYTGIDDDYSLRLVEVNSRAGFLNAYKTQYSLAKTGNPSANQYYLDKETKDFVFSSGSQGIGPRRNLLGLENWQVEDLLETKRKFAKAGFATYQDVESLCVDLLENVPELARLFALRFPLILVDECQDLSWVQIQILDSLRKNHAALHFVGDLNQAIYEFKRVAPKQVAQYVQVHKFVQMSLSNNYRSYQDISNLCSSLVDTKDEIVCKRKPLHNCPLICVLYSKEQIGSLPVWFSEYLKGLGIDRSHSAIVTRSWANVSRMRPANNGTVTNYQERLAMSFYLWSFNSLQAMDEALRLFGQFVAEKYFPRQHSFALEYSRPEVIGSAVAWRLYLARSLNRCCRDGQLNDFDMTWSDWGRAVRENLHNHLDASRDLVPELSDYDFSPLISKNKPHARKSLPVFASPSRKGDKQVSENLISDSLENTFIRITTVHKVKGETLAALMLVSSTGKSGTRDGHWTFWLDDPASEAARLAYVASSRPQQLLVWAIPDPSQAEKGRLESLGFKILALT
jgi:DNA helicase-2/ATP-dependent DNA helicase PcrA